MATQQTLDNLVDKKRAALKRIAEDTLEAIERGSYLNHDISIAITLSKQNTRFYAPDSLLSTWSVPAKSGSPPPYTPHRSNISLLEISTLEGARLLFNMTASSPSPSPSKIGVLNFASAKKAGGGFRSGAQAQEESIARSSTLYSTLMTAVAQAFYTLHNRDQKGGYYSHAMIYSPGVLVIRDDVGGWVEPLKIDVLTCAAVNAGVVYSQPKKLLNKGGGGLMEDEKIEKAMKERMGRILFLFESQGVKNLVLGSFGTGVFQNNVGVVAQIWADLLLVDGARFKDTFDNVVFAVLGRDTFEKFKLVFGPYNLQPASS